MRDEEFKYQYAGVITMVVSSFIFSRLCMQPQGPLSIRAMLALIMVASTAFLTWNFHKVNNRKLFHRLIFVSVLIAGVILIGFLHTPPEYF